MLGDMTSGSGAQVDNGDLKNILDPTHYIDRFLFISTTIFTVIGVPVNMLTIGVIFFLKRLHSPRNVIWIGIGVSNIIVLVSHLMFVLSATDYWGKDSASSSVLTQAIYSWFGCISIFSLTFNITAAICERHICVTYPKWHKRSVTITWIITLESSFFAFILLIPMIIVNLEIFQPYLSTFFDVWNVKLLGTLVTMISPLVLSGFVGVFTLGKTMIEQDLSPVTIKMENLRANKPYFNAADQQSGKNKKKRRIANAKENQTKRSTNYFIHTANNRISRLDSGAKQTFNYIACIYLIFMIPTLISFVSMLICLQVSPTSCSSFMGALYLIGVFMDCLHSSIVNPAAFVLLSKDFLEFFKSRACQNAFVIQQNWKIDETSNLNKMETIYEEPIEETDV